MTHFPNSRPDPFTLPIALRACTALSALANGLTVHALSIKSPNASSDMFVGAALIGLYSKCGDINDARRVLDGFVEPDVVLWTSVVSAYQQNGYPVEAVSMFRRMVVGRLAVPEPVTVVSLVAAIGEMGGLREGKCCHGFMVRMGFDSDLSLGNSILNLYAKMGAVEYGLKLFEGMGYRDVITWSCMVACYARNGMPENALGVYKRMVDVGVEPNSVTVISALQACSESLDLEQGRRLHDFVIGKGFEMELAVSTALIDMYMKCSRYGEAVDIFRRMPQIDVVSWAVVISGYAGNGFPSESLRLFKRMLFERVSLDAVVLVKVVSACSQLGVLRQAICIHGYLVGCGFDGKIFVGAALVDLYCKCGSLDSAIRVFKSANEKDVVLWSSMIAGYGIHGLGKEAIAAFEHMVESSIRPNNITFISVLSACSHAGLVVEGRMVFDSMSRVYGVMPDSEHCGIMVDILGRSGELDEAMRIIQGMSVPVGPHVWCALLAGCRTHHNIEMGELVAMNLLKLESGHAGYYNLLSNIYASDARWDNVADIRRAMKKRGVRKIPGYSSVEVGSEVYTFLAGERLHEELRSIYEILEKLEVEMIEEGYIRERCNEVFIEVCS